MWSTTPPLMHDFEPRRRIVEELALRGLSFESEASREFSFQHIDSAAAVAGQAAMNALFSPRPPKQYYKFWVVPWKFVKIRYDRLNLIALLDRTKSIKGAFASVILAVMVAAICATLLARGVFHDLGILLFCFVVASCQYSLIKSVQPDASSPTHGYNPTVVFSRPVYFVICGALAILLDDKVRSFVDGTNATGSFYGFVFDSAYVTEKARDGLLMFILCFPVIFSLGLLPQVNTFGTYALEQIDMHLFGGTAATGLWSAIYAVARSSAAVLALFGFCYAGLKEKSQSSQHILFSVFCGLLVAVSYHLSRSSSDPSVVWELVKSNFALSPEEDVPEDASKRTSEENQSKTEEKKKKDKKGKSRSPGTAKSKKKKKKTENEDAQKRDDEELTDPLPAKLADTVSRRFKSDLVISVIFGVLAFAVHCSTIFTAAEPIFGMAMWIAVGTAGFYLHYLLPHFRKQMPWKCFAHPFFQVS